MLERSAHTAAAGKRRRVADRDLPRDGDLDGKIYDGKWNEQPAPTLIDIPNADRAAAVHDAVEKSGKDTVSVRVARGPHKGRWIDVDYGNTEYAIITVEGAGGWPDRRKVSWGDFDGVADAGYRPPEQRAATDGQNSVFVPPAHTPDKGEIVTGIIAARLKTALGDSNGNSRLDVWFRAGDKATDSDPRISVDKNGDQVAEITWGRTTGAIKSLTMTPELEKDGFGTRLFNAAYMYADLHDWMRQPVHTRELHGKDLAPLSEDPADQTAAERLSDPAWAQFYLGTVDVTPLHQRIVAEAIRIAEAQDDNDVDQVWSNDVGDQIDEFVKDLAMPAESEQRWRHTDRPAGELLEKLFSEPGWKNSADFTDAVNAARNEIFDALTELDDIEERLGNRDRSDEQFAPDPDDYDGYDDDDDDDDDDGSNAYEEWEDEQRTILYDEYTQERSDERGTQIAQIAEGLATLDELAGSIGEERLGPARLWTDDDFRDAYNEALNGFSADERKTLRYSYNLGYRYSSDFQSAGKTYREDVLVPVFDRLFDLLLDNKSFVDGSGDQVAIAADWTETVLDDPTFRKWVPRGGVLNRLESQRLLNQEKRRGESLPIGSSTRFDEGVRLGMYRRWRRQAVANNEIFDGYGFINEDDVRNERFGMNEDYRVSWGLPPDDMNEPHKVHAETTIGNELASNPVFAAQVASWGGPAFVLGHSRGAGVAFALFGTPIIGWNVDRQTSAEDRYQYYAARFSDIVGFDVTSVPVSKSWLREQLDAAGIDWDERIDRHETDLGDVIRESGSDTIADDGTMWTLAEAFKVVAHAVGWTPGDTLRHEYGHTIEGRIQQFDIRRNQYKALKRSKGVQQEISDYAGFTTAEFFAEAYSIVTHPRFADRKGFSPEAEELFDAVRALIAPIDIPDRDTEIPDGPVEPPAGLLVSVFADWEFNAERMARYPGWKQSPRTRKAVADLEKEIVAGIEALHDGTDPDREQMLINRLGEALASYDLFGRSVGKTHLRFSLEPVYEGPGILEQTAGRDIPDSLRAALNTVMNATNGRVFQRVAREFRANPDLTETTGRLPDDAPLPARAAELYGISVGQVTDRHIRAAEETFRRLTGTETNLEETQIAARVLDDLTPNMSREALKTAESVDGLIETLPGWNRDGRVEQIVSSIERSVRETLGGYPSSSDLNSVGVTLLEADLYDRSIGRPVRGLSRIWGDTDQVPDAQWRKIRAGYQSDAPKFVYAANVFAEAEAARETTETVDVLVGLPDGDRASTAVNLVEDVFSGLPRGANVTSAAQRLRDGINRSDLDDGAKQELLDAVNHASYYVSNRSDELTGVFRDSPFYIDDLDAINRGDLIGHGVWSYHIDRFGLKFGADAAPHSAHADATFNRQTANPVFAAQVAAWGAPAFMLGHNRESTAAFMYPGTRLIGWNRDNVDDAAQQFAHYGALISERVGFDVTETPVSRVWLSAELERRGVDWDEQVPSPDGSGTRPFLEAVAYVAHNVGLTAGDTLRHEYGHLVDGVLGKHRLRRELREHLNHGVADELSTYAGFSDPEFFAEAYSIVTHPRFADRKGFSPEAEELFEAVRALIAPIDIPDRDTETPRPAAPVETTADVQRVEQHQRPDLKFEEMVASVLNNPEWNSNGEVTGALGDTRFALHETLNRVDDGAEVTQALAEKIGQLLADMYWMERSIGVDVAHGYDRLTRPSRWSDPSIYEERGSAPSFTDADEDRVLRAYRSATPAVFDRLYRQHVGDIPDNEPQKLIERVHHLIGKLPDVNDLPDDTAVDIREKIRAAEEWLAEAADAEHAATGFIDATIDQAFDSLAGQINRTAENIEMWITAAEWFENLDFDALNETNPSVLQSAFDAVAAISPPHPLRFAVKRPLSRGPFTGPLYQVATKLAAAEDYLDFLRRAGRPDTHLQIAEQVIERLKAADVGILALAPEWGTPGRANVSDTLRTTRGGLAGSDSLTDKQLYVKYSRMEEALYRSLAEIYADNNELDDADVAYQAAAAVAEQAEHLVNTTPELGEYDPWDINQDWVPFSGYETAPDVNWSPSEPKPTVVGTLKWDTYRDALQAQALTDPDVENSSDWHNEMARIYTEEAAHYRRTDNPDEADDAEELAEEHRNRATEIKLEEEAIRANQLLADHAKFSAEIEQRRAERAERARSLPPDKWGEPLGITGSFAEAADEAHKEPIVGAAFAYDGDAIEGFNVRRRQTRYAFDTEPVAATQFQFKVRGDTGIAEYMEDARVLSDGDGQEYVSLQSEDRGVLERVATGDRYEGSGATWVQADKLADGTPFEVRWHSVDTDHERSPYALGNLIQVVVQGDTPSQDQFDEIMGRFGVTPGYPSVPDVEAYKRALLDDLFTVSEWERPGTLKGVERAETEFGITPDDITFETINGRVIPVIPRERAEEIVNKSSVTAFIQEMSGSRSVDGWVDLIEKRHGLMSGVERRTNGMTSPSVPLGRRPGSGMSPTSDIISGGADYVFVRPRGPRGRGGTPDSLFVREGVVIDAARALRRLDWFAWKGDQYGTRREPLGNNVRNMSFKSALGEVMFRGTIPFDDWAQIVISDKTKRSELIRRLENKGVTEINGVPTSDFIVAETLEPPPPGMAMGPYGTYDHIETIRDENPWLLGDLHGEDDDILAARTLNLSPEPASGPPPTATRDVSIEGTTRAGKPYRWKDVDPFDSDKWTWQKGDVSKATVDARVNALRKLAVDEFPVLADADFEIRYFVDWDEYRSVASPNNSGEYPLAAWRPNGGSTGGPAILVSPSIARRWFYTDPALEMRVLAHELVHAASPQNVPNSGLEPVLEEGMAEILSLDMFARRIADIPDVSYGRDSEHRGIEAMVRHSTYTDRVAALIMHAADEIGDWDRDKIKTKLRGWWDEGSYNRAARSGAVRYERRGDGLSGDARAAKEIDRLNSYYDDLIERLPQHAEEYEEERRLIIQEVDREIDTWEHDANKRWERMRSEAIAAGIDVARIQQDPKLYDFELGELPFGLTADEVAERDSINLSLLYWLLDGQRIDDQDAAPQVSGVEVGVPGDRIEGRARAAGRVAVRLGSNRFTKAGKKGDWVDVDYKNETHAVVTITRDNGRTAKIAVKWSSFDGVADAGYRGDTPLPPVMPPAADVPDVPPATDVPDTPEARTRAAVTAATDLLDTLPDDPFSGAPDPIENPAPINRTAVEESFTKRVDRRINPTPEGVVETQRAVDYIRFNLVVGDKFKTIENRPTWAEFTSRFSEFVEKHNGTSLLLNNHKLWNMFLDETAESLFPGVPRNEIDTDRVGEAAAGFGLDEVSSGSIPKPHPFPHLLELTPRDKEHLGTLIEAGRHLWQDMQSRKPVPLKSPDDVVLPDPAISLAEAEKRSVDAHAATVEAVEAIDRDGLFDMLAARAATDHDWQGPVPVLGRWTETIDEVASSFDRGVPLTFEDTEGELWSIWQIFTGNDAKRASLVMAPGSSVTEAFRSDTMVAIPGSDPAGKGTNDAWDKALDAARKIKPARDALRLATGRASMPHDEAVKVLGDAVLAALAKAKADLPAIRERLSPEAVDALATVEDRIFGGSLGPLNFATGLVAVWSMPGKTETSDGLEIRLDRHGELSIPYVKTDSDSPWQKVILTEGVPTEDVTLFERAGRQINSEETERKRLFTEMAQQGRDDEATAVAEWLNDAFGTGATPEIRSEKGKLTRAQKERADNLAKAVGQWIPAAWVESVKPVYIDAGRGRAHYRRNSSLGPKTGVIKLAANDDLGTYLHEYGHHLQGHDPEISRAVWAFYTARTGGTDPEVLYGDLPGEKGRPDEFFSRYAGRDYGNATVRPSEAYYSSEVFTMGLEGTLAAHTSPNRRGIDDEYAAFILGLLMMRSRKKGSTGKWAAAEGTPVTQPVEGATIGGDGGL